MKPTVLDWLTLVYLIAFAFAQIAMVLGVATSSATFVVSSFPFGLFLLALCATILRNLVPATRFNFGFSGARWGTIVSLLIVIGHAVYGLSFVRRTADDLFGSALLDDNLLSLVMLGFPGLIAAMFLIYVVIVLFLGLPIGPIRKNPT